MLGWIVMLVLIATASGLIGFTAVATALGIMAQSVFAAALVILIVSIGWVAISGR
jgi:hypothetical protein